MTSKWNNIVIPVCKFQSTHPRRVWRPFNTHTGVQVSFNPHTHAGCDHSEANDLYYYNVSIHTPTQGVTIDYGDKTHILMFQSTHPRRVWRSITSFSRARSVSIHTPTQGVTFYHLLKINFYPVSIHTPTQGVTISPHSRRPTGRSFNPHTHAGCDPGTGYLACRIPAVSIHTPTQGVTKFVFYFFMCHNCFNPHTHAGCDGSWVFWFNKFQGFNPHTHAGCDSISNNIL